MDETAGTVRDAPGATCLIIHASMRWGERATKDKARQNPAAKLAFERVEVVPTGWAERVSSGEMERDAEALGPGFGGTCEGTFDPDTRTGPLEYLRAVVADGERRERERSSGGGDDKSSAVVVPAGDGGEGRGGGAAEGQAGPIRWYLDECLGLDRPAYNPPWGRWC